LSITKKAGSAGESLENFIAPFLEIGMIRKRHEIGKNRRFIYAKMGVYGEKNRFQGFKPTLLFGTRADPFIGARRGGMGADIGRTLSERGKFDHVLEKADRRGFR